MTCSSSWMNSYIPQNPSTQRRCKSPMIRTITPSLSKNSNLRRGLADSGTSFLPDQELGAGLSVHEYAPLAEITGRSVSLAPEALNCAAPDTGNMEMLHMFGTEEQKERWLLPLLEGEIRSCFSMTEPDVASSDARNIRTRIESDGDDYVIHGRKWFSSGASSPRCKVGDRHGRH